MNKAGKAVVFIDGNNWYHALTACGLTDLGRLSYSKISQKLLGPREWAGTRYYVGQVKEEGNTDLYANQRRFIARLQAEDKRISVIFGRLEKRFEKNLAAIELKHYLANLKVRIDVGVYKDLVQLAQRHASSMFYVEKATDVGIAVDMVTMAQRGEYDSAYLLSADGDFTPAVMSAKSSGAKVYAASPACGAELASVVDSYIPLTKEWFLDCFRDD